jgi:hypothetical protein
MPEMIDYEAREELLDSYLSNQRIFIANDASFPSTSDSKTKEYTNNCFTWRIEQMTNE